MASQSIILSTCSCSCEETVTGVSTILFQTNFENGQHWPVREEELPSLLDLNAQLNLLNVNVKLAATLKWEQNRAWCRHVLAT
jgi:hypothetical protein